MNLVSLAILTLQGALGGAAHSAVATPARLSSGSFDPRTPISAATTPGDADSVYRISKPGSYYLTGKVIGPAGHSGIEIAASHVTIDLNGFRLQGAAGSLDGIRAELPGTTSIRIYGGSLSGWGGDGLDLDVASRVAVSQVDVAQCAGMGLWLGDDARVSDVTANECFLGVFSGARSVFERVAAGLNTDKGIYVGNASILKSCAAGSNTLSGIQVGLGSTVSDCAVTGNGTTGLFAGSASTLVGCSANSNGASGINLTSGGGLIENCTSIGNAGNGITAGATSVVRSCSASSNGGKGFSLTTGVITGCSASANSEDGFSVSSGSIVSGNLSRSNGGNAFRLTGTGTTFVSNTLDNGWSFASGNRIGPLVSTTGTLPSTTSPYANFID